MWKCTGNGSSYSNLRRCWIMMMTRMMQSEIDSPCSRTFCSLCHVSESIGIRQLPFAKRGKICSKGNSAAMRARHSSVTSMSGIGSR